jgi:FixJ family two-component response regulator
MPNVRDAPNPLIAIVDDDVATCNAIQRLLRSNGLEASTYNSTATFLASGRLQNLNCLILDVRMPGLSGPELQKCLLKANVILPIIYVTGFADEAVRLTAKETGTIAILEKPFDNDILVAQVKAVLHVFR